MTWPIAVVISPILIPSWDNHHNLMAHAFWKNLIQLISGEPHEPGDGRDERGIRYLFGSAGFLNEGRRLFDLAECLSHNFDAIQERTAAFLVSE